MKQYITETFVLNPPKFELSNINKYKNEVLYIKKDNNNYIPVLFIQDLEQCNKFLIIFHGNNEHIFELEMAAGVIREKLKMNVIVVEYPGYSIYFSKRSPKIIMEDATIVYDFIRKKFEVKDEDIFIYGRSIGSAPSIYLASKRNAKALFVVSGFSTLKEVGKGLYVGWALEDIFKNIEYISKVTIPTLFIHGKKDSLISWEQSMQLMDKCGSKRKDIKLIDNMTHNSYNLIDDIINKINSFLLNQFNGINSISNYYNLYDKKFDDILTMPKTISKYIDNFNFTLKGYSINEKSFEKYIYFMILLENERLALVFNNQINVCDTTNFKTFYSVQNINKIIFADSLKNGHFFYYDNDGFITIIKFEFTNYTIILKIKIDEYLLNTCKIIELDDYNLLVMKKSFCPLFNIKIEKDNNSDKYKYELTKVKAFEDMILDDIIYIENNKYAVTCSKRNLLIIYNYSTKEINEKVINFDSSSSLFFAGNQYLIILNNIDFIIFDLSSNKLFFRNFYTNIQFFYSIETSYFVEPSYFVPTFCLYENHNILLIGNNNGKIFKIDLENLINDKTKKICISNDEIIQVDQSAIKKILLLSNKVLLVQTEKNTNNIYFCHKNDNNGNNQPCMIY